MIAEEKNKTPLPSIDKESTNSILKMGSSTEQCLINNNFQVYSEDIQKRLQEDKAKILAKVSSKSLEERK